MAEGRNLGPPTTVRFPMDVKEALDIMSAATGQPISHLIVDAVRIFVMKARKSQDFRDYVLSDLELRRKALEKFLDLEMEEGA